MKKTSSLLSFFLLSLFTLSFTLTGCGDKKEGEEVADSTKEAAEASSEASGEISAKFKDGMINLSKEMIDIAENVKTPEDVTEAEPRIAEVMDNLTGMFTEFANNFDNLTESDAKGLQNIADDPEVKKWTEKMQATMEKLKTEHPEAAAKLKETTEKHSEKFQQAMMGLMAKAFQKMGQGTAGAGAATEGDTAAGH